MGGKAGSARHPRAARSGVSHRARHLSRHLTAIVETAPFAIAVTTPDGRVLYVNRHADEMLGFPAGTIAGARTQDFYIDLEDRRAMFEEFARVGVIDDREVFMRRADGSTLATRVSLRWIEVAGETAVLSIVANADARHQLAQAMAARERRHRQLLDNLSDHVFRLELPERRVSYANPASQAVFGYPAEFLMQPLAFFSILHPDDRPRFEQWRLDLEAGHVAPTFEYRVIDPNGQTRVILQSNHLSSDAAGNVVSLEGVCRDVTAAHRAASELAARRAELEASLTSRTRELEQSREESMRNERLAAIGQLVGIVGHELRTPLGTIRNSVVELASAPATGSQSALARMDRAVARCDRIIDELLHFARAPLPEPEHLDLRASLTGILAEMDIPDEVETTFTGEESVWIDVDPDWLRRCVENLVRNACQAMTGRTPQRLTMRLTVTLHSVLFSVEDNGHGMSTEEEARALEPLYSTRSFGVGLGLPIAARFARAHGGVLELASRVNEGTRVSVTLPRLYEARPERTAV